MSDKQIHKFIKRDTFEKMMFAWMQCLECNLPAVTLVKAAENFMKYYGYGYDEINIQTMITTYQRMKKEYYDNQKSVNDNENE